MFDSIKKPSSTSTVAASPIVRKALSSPGRPLDQRTRDFIEARFAHDFSQVRVHADENAGEAASSVDAHAFTTGPHIVFGAGTYAPETDRGRRLLAHELTHVVQQRNGVHLEGGRGKAADSYESEADAVSNRIARGEVAAPLLRANGGQSSFGSSTSLQMQEDPEKKKKPGAFPNLLMGIKPMTLDDNPALGVMQRMKMLAESHTSASKSSMEEESPTSMFTNILAALERFDKSLTGNAEQSFGLNMSGSGTNSKESTASKASKDTVFLSSKTVDLVEVLEMMSIAVLSVSRPSDMFVTPKKFRDDPAKELFNLRKKLVAAQQAIEDERKREAAGDESQHARTVSKVLTEVRNVEMQIRTEIQQASPEQKAKVEGQEAAKTEPSVSNVAKKTTKGASSSKESWGDDPFWYYVMQPGAVWGDGSGDRFSAEGEIEFVTSANGTRRKFHMHVDARGYGHSKLLEILPASKR